MVISDTNLSHAWGRALRHVVKNPGDEIKPLIVSITGFDDHGQPNEDNDIRTALDAFLKTQEGARLFWFFIDFFSSKDYKIISFIQIIVMVC